MVGLFRPEINLGGYVCLKTSVLWGICTVLMIYVLNPVFTGLVDVDSKALGRNYPVGAFWPAYCRFYWNSDCCLGAEKRKTVGSIRSEKALDVLQSFLKIP